MTTKQTSDISFCIASGLEAEAEKVIADILAEDEGVDESTYLESINDKHGAWMAMGAARDMSADDLKDMYDYILTEINSNDTGRMEVLLSMHGHILGVKPDAYTPWLEMLHEYNEGEIYSALKKAAHVEFLEG